MRPRLGAPLLIAMTLVFSVSAAPAARTAATVETDASQFGGYYAATDATTGGELLVHLEIVDVPGLGEAAVATIFPPAGGYAVRAGFIIRVGSSLYIPMASLLPATDPYRLLRDPATVLQQPDALVLTAGQCGITFLFDDQQRLDYACTMPGSNSGAGGKLAKLRPS